MIIPTSDQIRNLDQVTIREEPIESIDLMERASSVFVGWFISKFDFKQPVLVFCGPGNNGGDGLAIARMLYQAEFQVRVFLIDFDRKRASTDLLTNLKRLKDRTSIAVEIIRKEDTLPDIGKEEIVIDAIFGSGLSRPAAGFFAEVIQHINSNAERIVSVDIPSGLFADSHTSGLSIRSSHTFSFEFPKLAFFLAENVERVGHWEFQTIGLNREHISSMDCQNFMVTLEMCRAVYKPRKKFGHKGTFGHSLILAGSKGKIGAAILAAKGTLRAGSGLLSVAVPECGYRILQTAIPEAMVLTDKKENYLSELPMLDTYQAIGAGCGMGQHKLTADLIKELLKNAKVPLVLDADALNMISKKNWLKNIPKNSILSPHPKEFERLFGPSENDFSRLELLRSSAVKHELYIILKGAHTAIATPQGKIYFNSTGNPGMGTAGAGDVLTGILTGLLSQKYTSEEAAILGVYLHGLAGDIFIENNSLESLLASDIAESLGKAFMKIYPENI